MNIWIQRALALSKALPPQRLHSRVLLLAQGRGVIGRGLWHVALSGGADSVCLLLLLWAHFPAARSRLRVLHFNHRLRGRESAADARFCASLAKGLGLVFKGGTWVTAKKDASEAEARRARMEFFLQCLGNGGCLFLGHQRDDIAESLFMRLARGSGVSGLAAPRPVQRIGKAVVHLRPLLDISKAEIRSQLSKADIPWREDSSNAGDRHLRNRMRQEVLPAWSKASGGRDALAGAALSREYLEENEEALEAWFRELKPLKRARRLELKPLTGRPRALWRLALHRWLLSTPYRGDLSRQGFDLLLDGLMRGTFRRQSLGKEAFALLEDGFLVYRGGRLRSRGLATGVAQQRLLGRGGKDRPKYSPTSLSVH